MRRRRVEPLSPWLAWTRAVALVALAACDDGGSSGASEAAVSEAEPAVVERRVRGLMPAEARSLDSPRDGAVADGASTDPSPGPSVSDDERITPLNLEAELNKLQAEIGD